MLFVFQCYLFGDNSIIIFLNYRIHFAMNKKGHFFVSSLLRNVEGVVP